MDFRNIRAFVRVAELKSFSKAAAEMDYVQSTVTMQVQQLEWELGHTLFDRIGRKVSLTALGAEFLTCAYEILHVVGKAENWAQSREAAGAFCASVCWNRCSLAPCRICCPGSGKIARRWSCS